MVLKLVGLMILIQVLFRPLIVKGENPLQKTKQQRQICNVASYSDIYRPITPKVCVVIEMAKLCFFLISLDGLDLYS